MRQSQILTSRAIRGMFFHRLEEVSMASWAPRVAHMFDSDQDVETYSFLGQSPALVEWIGSRRKKEPRGWQLTVTNKTYEASVEFSVNDLRRDKTTQTATRIGDLAARAAILPQQVLSDLLDAGASGTAYDASAFYADRSALKTGGQINNLLTSNISDPTKPTSAEMASLILDCINKLYEALDDEDQPLNEFATTFGVMVPAMYWSVLTAAISNEFTSSGVSNTIPNSGLSIVPIVNPRLTIPATTGEFHVMRLDADVMPLIWQDEVAADLDSLAEGSDYEFFNDAHVYGVKRIGNGTYGEPGLAARGQFTAGRGGQHQMANVTLKYGSSPNEINERLISDEAIEIGRILVDGVGASTVQLHVTETAGFAGISMSEATAAAGRLDVRRKGVLITSINATVAAGDEGTAVYMVASGTAVTAITTASTSNLPIGKIATVLTAGTLGANLVAIAFEASGYVSV